MRQVPLLCGVALLACLQAAAADSCEPFHAKFDRVGVGDNWTKIASVFGPPTASEDTADGGTNYVYRLSGCTVTFRAGANDKVTAKEAHPPFRTNSNSVVPTADRAGVQRADSGASAQTFEHSQQDHSSESRTAARSNSEGREVYTKAAQSVFLLLAKSSDGQITGQGSGFLVAGGRVITNRHVVSAGSILIDLGSVRLPATIERIDEFNDLAVLTTNAEISSNPLSLDAAAPVPGDTIFAIGNPEGLQRSITAGVVSGIREIEGRRLIQISAPISPGSSGGPILNRSGEVIGVAVGMLRDGQNLNFCVPADLVLSLIMRSASGTGHGSQLAMEEIEKLRGERSQTQYSTEEGSPWQQIESRITQLWQKALDDAGDDITVLGEISRSAQLENIDASLSAAERIVRLKPTPEAEMSLIAALQLKSGWVSDGAEKTKLLTRAEQLARAMVRTPKQPSPNVIYTLASILEDKDDFTEASATFQRALDASRNSRDPQTEDSCLRGLVRVAYALNRPADGEAWFKALAGTGRANAYDWWYQGDRYAGSGKFLEAGQAHQTAALLIGSWKCWCKAAVEFSFVGSYQDQTLTCARKCIEMGAGQKDSDDDLMWAHIEIADVLNSRGVYEEGLSHAKEAVSINGSNPWAWSSEADAFFGLRRFQETINAAKQAIRLSDGKYGMFHFRLGAAYYETENWEFARQSFEKAAELTPTDTAAPYNVALCLVRLGMFQDAATWYEEVLRRDPNYKDREELLKRIAALRR